MRGEPKSVAWWCDTLIESTCQDATKELGVPLMHPRTNRMHCLLHAQLIDTVRVLPTEITTMHLPPVVNAPAPEPSEAVEPLVSELSFPDAVGDDTHVDTATFEQTGDPLLLIGRASGQRSQGDTAEALYLSPFQ